MSKHKTGNNKYLKEYNQAGILDLIRLKKAVSRAELSELTGLTPTAAGIIVSNLLERGLIGESGIGESSGGRRPVLLELKSHSFFTVGVDLDTSYLNLALMDITGSTVGESFIKLSENIGFCAVMSSIESLVGQLLQQHDISTDKLLGIGISVPGLVDADTGEIILAPNLGWRNVNVKESLSGLTDIPVYLENEAMASAVAENWIGSCQGIQNFICINVKSGIGAGIFVNGKLYRGASGSAGEVGHIFVDEAGAKCACGNYGCLETRSSTTHIVEKAKKLVRQGTVSSINNAGDVEQINIDTIIAAAREQDEIAKSILVESARYIGIAVSSLINILNPSRIVLGKEFVKYGDLVLDQLKKTALHKALELPGSKADIIITPLGEKASMLGAAIIPLKVLFGK